MFVTDLRKLCADNAVALLEIRKWADSGEMDLQIALHSFEYQTQLCTAVVVAIPWTFVVMLLLPLSAGYLSVIEVFDMNMATFRGSAGSSLRVMWCRR